MRIWKGVSSSHLYVLEEATAYLLAWQKINVEPLSPPIPRQFQKWSKPPHGWLKLDTDASVNVGSKVSGLGFVVRDSEGAFVAAKSSTWFVSLQPKFAEALALREALL
ncbi:uncharacterized protein LOC116014898 [Ipomoea triloba]|uniref:uncharacterized protein LOC116014898 n=1 Tax=Ipomoea triloba TaxID=35885 RepID=UPI00125DC519|nr:uncharacterized protein LOC116014898 [Ipomoea triloba]